MPDLLANFDALQLFLTAALGMLIALSAKRGPSYWPVVRILAMIIGLRGMFYIMLRVLYWSATPEHYLEITNEPLWRGLYYGLQLGGMLWAIWIIDRTNRQGKTVNLVGQELNRDDACDVPTDHYRED